MSTTALQQHGRSIATGFTPATLRQGTECGTLNSSIDGEEGTGGKEGLTVGQQIGVVLAVLVLLLGGAAIGGA